MALLEWRFSFDKPAEAYIKGLEKGKIWRGGNKNDKIF